MTNGLRFVMVGIWAIWPLPACSLGEPVTCSGITCTNALVVDLAGAVPSSYTVEVRADNQTRRFTCSSASLCDEAVFGDFTPTRVTILVEWSGGSTEQVVTPAYELLQPNGPDCPPTCRVAVVTITIAG